MTTKSTASAIVAGPLAGAWTARSLFGLAALLSLERWLDPGPLEDAPLGGAGPLLESGQVAFHHRAEPLSEELPRFPKGSKDLTDAFCHGALWLEERYWKGLGVQEAPVPLLLSR